MSLVGAEHTFQHVLGLAVDQVCEQLLRVAKYQRPGESLCGRVQCAKARHELATHEQRAEEGRECARGQLERGQASGGGAELDPRRWFHLFRVFRDASLLERAKCNLDAAEANLLSIAPPDYVLGQVSSVLTEVQYHLIPNDPRWREMDRIARKLGVTDQDSATLPNAETPLLSDLCVDRARTAARRRDE